MKRFNFSLEGVLKWKRSQEEEALKRMGEGMRRRQEAYEGVQLSRRHLGALLTAIRDARQGKIDSWSQVAYIREVARQEAVCKHMEETLQKAINEEEVLRTTYLLRRREAEALQKLREKREDIYQKQADRLTEIELEEIMLSREGNVLCS